MNRRRDHANDIRNSWKHRHGGAFTPGWWHGHPGHLPAYPRWHSWHAWQGNPNYWWRRATATALTAWAITPPWGAPVYYDYGAGGNVYYEGDTVYIDGQAAATADEYTEQAYAIADSSPEIAEDQEVEWLPLGVFAVTDEGAAASNMLLQLAVSKEGVIGGTFFNESTDMTLSVEGTVDKDTQRAAWTAVDDSKQYPVMETGIYNLTQDETPVLIHFGDGQTQEWLLVRLEEPAGE